MLSWGRLRFFFVPRAISANPGRTCSLRALLRPWPDPHARRLSLIFVSFAERYIRIVADDGLCTKIPDAAWRPAVDGLAAAIRSGDLAGGLVAAIDTCRAPLALHFQAQGSGHTLPDKVYVV